MDEGELRKLLKTKNGCRVPKMWTIPDPKTFEPLPPFIPLPPYRRSKDKEAGYRKACIEKASQKKLAIASRSLPTDADKLKTSPRQHLYISELRKCAGNRHPPSMTEAWESKILKSIPNHLRERFPELTEELFGECKTEWDQVLTDLAVASVIRKVPGVARKRYQETPYKFKGITSNQVKMMRYKRKLREGTLFVHPFIRLILQSSQRIFPYSIVDLRLYREMGTFTLETFKIKLRADLKQADYLITNTWYGGTLTKWLKNPRCLRSMKEKIIPKFLRCATKMIAFQVQELMRRSIDDSISCIGDTQNAPVFIIDLDFDEEFILEPSLDTIYEQFENSLINLTTIAQKLIPIEHYLKLPYTFDSLPVSYNEWLLADAKKRLREKFIVIEKPISDYLYSIRDQFSMLYGTQARAALKKFINKSKNFEDFRDKIKYFQSVDADITGLVENVYFDNIIVNQIRMVESLKKKASQFVTELIAGTIKSHITENHSICAEFKRIAEKALKPPKNAEELAEQGVYILKAKTELVEALAVRIYSQISIVVHLLEMTSLTSEHVALNTKIVNWLKDIKEVFQKNAYAYEASKIEMEENLMSKINDLGAIIKDINPYLETLDHMDDINNTLEYLEYLRKLVHRLDDCDKRVAWINSEETTFKFPISQYPDLEELKDIILPFHRLVYLVHKWRRSYYTWMDGTFEYLDHEEIEGDHDFYYKKFLEQTKIYKNKIKTQIAEGVEKRFSGLVDDPDINKLPAPLKLCAQAIAELKNWRPNIQLAHIMCNKALFQRHWDEMSQIAGFDLTPDAGTTLRKITKLDLWEKIDEYEVISIAATKQLALVTNLNKIISEWDDICFKTSLYKDTEISILTGLDDIQSILDEHIVKTISMRGSAFVKPFETQVHNWYSKIKRMNATIDEWRKVQSQWLHLWPIFSSSDIKAQMPNEDVLFIEVKNINKRSMRAVEKDPHVIEIAGGVGVLESFQSATALLERINEGVNNYLEKKRLYFPRFFFLSNDEMLEILSETKNPLNVQPHLKKCFEGIDRLVFDEDYNISAMLSPEEEKVDFVTTINVAAARGSVEKWLVQVEEQMLKAIRSEMELSYNDYGATTSRTAWILSWEGMVVLAISQIYWAINVQDTLLSHDINELRNYYDSLNQQLNETVAIVRRPDLTKINNITVKALIVIDVHAKDVILELIDKNVTRHTDFQWLAQLRYYWEDGNILVSIINATVDYAYEYLGNTDRLVITPLTDRCYRTLIGAYNLHLNGAPEGPAGTGKTETTKDLAKAIAVQCVVFNCSEGLDYKTMGKFFKGLASCGAWACFDEFNRIDVEVLSVIAQQILTIMQAIRQNVTKIILEGSLINLNPACYVCITMNPGYAGRSELPDNLKVLFRTVAMMVPDYAMIGEISLYSFGFLDARNLSVKIVTTYKLCSEQLSSQNHYDYGMRTVKAVLSAAGNLKRNHPDENESLLLLRSINEVNLPKFLFFDVPLFEGIIRDLFPGTNLPKTNYDILLEACSQCCSKCNIQPIPGLLSKIVQIYEMTIVRHGFMLVGDPFAGKSTSLKILSDSLTLMHEHGSKGGYVCNYKVVNPKAVTIGQLYGYFDPISYEWFDGVVANMFRNFATDSTVSKKWLVFDGPVDAVWIESLNTVLDDNKKLCLTSGEVITMTKDMSMIFEVLDLSQASPATVSRCGMIYMESTSVGYTPIIKSWITTLNPFWLEENEEFLFDLCDWLFGPLITYVKRSCLQLVSAGDMNLVVSTLRLVEMLMDSAIAGEEDTKHCRTWIIASFMYAFVWGVGGILDHTSRDKFDCLVREYFKGDKELPPTIERIDISFPSEGLLIDNFYVYKGKGCWKPWNEHVKTVQIVEEISLLQTMIPTADTEKYTFLLEMHTKFVQPMILIGPTGTGKSFYVQNYLMNRIDMNKYSPGLITFTTTTTASQTQNLVLSKLFKRRKNNFGPPNGKKAIIFIDDMNMSAKEIYGAQPAIELLRLYFDQKYWFDLKSTDQILIYDTFFYGAIAPVGGSRQLICPRMLRHFNIYSINEFSRETMSRIFSTLLQHGLRKNGFGQDVQPLIINIVAATIEIYHQVSDGLLPTPAKSHYIFNLRDISRVIQGCGLLRKESADSKKVFYKLWVHEVMRVFYDRLVDDTDRTWLFDIIKKTTRNILKDTIEVVLDNYLNSDGKVTQDSTKTLMFGCYLDTDSPEGERRYEEVPSQEEIYNMAFTMLAEYNAIHKEKLNLVLFNYALEHLSKICRLLSMPSGNGLLIGVGGSGRQSLTKLAGCMLGRQTFQPTITKAYGVKAWHDDIKSVLIEAGGYNKDITFLLTENQIKNEIFIENIDSLLNSGEVPNIYGLEEREQILELVRLPAQGGNRNLDISPLKVMSFFVNRCRMKLHLALCFSPYSSSFRIRLRLCPSLVNCCTIDWYDSWPEEALYLIADHFMEKVHLPDSVKKAAILAFKQFHVDARQVSLEFYKQTDRKTYVTSASYLDLIKSFTILTNSKQRELKAAKLRYLNGLEKLNQAEETITAMQKELNALKPQLLEMTNKSAKMMEEIKTEKAIADRATAQVKADQKIANVQAAAAEELKKDCEADLALALPILEDAIAALNTLKPGDITIVKSMKNPPATVKLVMASVCVMKGIPPDRIPDPNNPGRKIMDYWAPSKRILGDMSFLESLKHFDKDNIPDSTMAKIRKEYLTNKDFKPHIIAKASTAAEGLCKWIIAMDMYDAVAKVVAPKKAKLETAEKEYSQTIAILDEKKATVKKLEQKLAELNEALQEANIKKKALEEEVKLCIDKLHRAEKLIGGLGGEKHRWTKVAEELQLRFDNLAGDILVSCGVIAYLAPYIMHTREEVIKKWLELITELKVPHSKSYSLKDVLETDIKIQNWCIFGLPNDEFSIDNAVILYNTMRWSLLVDPQGQANKWIKFLEKSNDIQIVKFTDNDYMSIIEACLEYGKPALIECVLEELEPPLDPILLKQTYTQCGKEYIAFGDNAFEYHPNFRLYITTRLRNPHYAPEIFNKVTVINFALTKEGLEDQLLGIVVSKERPDLQKKRENLIIQGAANKADLKRVEEDILRTLHETKDILEDATAIEILDSSKMLAVDIMKKQETSLETEIVIERFRQNYRPIASHSAVLYFSVTELPNVDPMYQYSLQWYIHLFVSSIEHANKSKDLKKRLNFLKESFTYSLYSNVCRSLFDKDKLVFSFIMCTKIMLSEGEIHYNDYLFLITGGIPVQNLIQNSVKWLHDKTWDEICRLSDLPAFKNFKESFVESEAEWKNINDNMEPGITLPGHWNNTLTAFQKLLVTRVLRSDKLPLAITKFVKSEMGQKYIIPPPFDIGRSYGDSNCLIPLIFILSPGLDPMDALTKQGERLGQKVAFVSLGQGQGPIATAAIKAAQTEGTWICLQNCHLAVSWLPALEKIIEGFDLCSTDLNFRLWLTSYPTIKIPQSILEIGVKITNEPPTGLRNNLFHSYISEPLKETDFLDGCPGKDKPFSKLLYGLGFFHAVVQERKNFGSLGWNIQYEFNDSDFKISVMQIQMFLNQYEEIQYDAITYLTGECNYGGRVTDDWDRRLLVTIVQNFVNIEVVNDPNYLFCKVGPEYGLPRRCEYQNYLKQIELLPEHPPPEVFGLHLNASITKDNTVFIALTTALVLVEGKGNKRGSGDTEDILLQMSSEILGKLPDEFDIYAAKEKYPVDYSESMNTVLVQELDRFNKLTKVIKNSLLDLQKAQKGLIIMSPVLHQQVNSMLLGRIPDNWKKVSYPSLKPLPSYIADLLKRLKVLQNWYLNDKPPTYWLSGFFFTHAFLTGSMQNYARANKLPIDILVFDFDVRKHDDEKISAKHGVYVNGLFMDGGRWDREIHKIQEQHPRILYDSMPCIWLYPKVKSQFKVGSRYQCPLYKTMERKGILSTTGHSTNFVLSFYLPSDKPPQHWIMRSVALLLQLNN